MIAVEKACSYTSSNLARLCQGGEAIMMLRCLTCAAEVPASQKFCPFCGRPLSGAASRYAPPAVYAPAQAAPAPLTPAYVASPEVALTPQMARGRRQPSQVAQPGKEKRHHWIWLGNLITIGIGGWVIYDHWQGTVGLDVAIALFALAALSLGLSRFGARWNRASCLEKLLIIPGVLAGLVMLAVIVLSGLDSDSGSSHGSSSSSHSGGGHHSKSGDGDSGDSGDFDGGDSDGARRGGQANRLPFITCPRCGQMLPANTRFCFRCGQPL